jgi:BirA family biotin operon repressor/biotin-[acetyl-CoA-carboxylase] ligase
VTSFDIPGRRVEWFDSVDSTMTVAARLAREGCAHGTAVVADRQDAGIGRHGRSWYSAAGDGLYVSLVLRIARPLPTVMLALGLAARDAIAQTGLQPDLRWPNDVLLNGLKCAGVLAQVEDSAVVAGIGINIAQREFPSDFEATSLLLQGATTTREAVLVALVEAVDRYCSMEPDQIRKSFETLSSFARGRRVRVEDTALEGVTRGLDPSGFLIVRADDGRETTVVAGGVRPCS